MFQKKSKGKGEDADPLPDGGIDPRFGAILATIEEGVLVLDVAGRVSFLNSAAARILDAPATTIAGHHHADLMTAADAGPEAGHDEAHCAICRALARGGRESVAEARFWSWSGEELVGSFTVASVPSANGGDAAVVVFRDLTPLGDAREKARSALEKLTSERRARTQAEADREWLYQLFEQVPALVGITRGADHVLEFANRALRATTGDRVLLGRPYAQALPEFADADADAVLDRVYASGVAYVGSEDLIRLEARDGPALRYLNRTVQPIRLADGARGLLLHHSDVTENVLGRRELEIALSSLKNATEELARSNEELDQFAYAASHDLKAPLRGINHLATWLEEDFGAGLDPKGREYLALIRARIGRLEMLIEGLLDYSRIGRAAAPRRRVDVGQVAQDVVDLVPTPVGVGVELRGPFPSVDADPIRLRQLLQNLLSNAVKHARETVEIRSEGLRPDDGLHVFAVVDDGPGIPEEYRDRIWEMFQRLEGRDETEGTGIGLALVRKIAREAGGDAWVEAAAAGGSRFLFTWPVAVEEEEAA